MTNYIGVSATRDTHVCDVSISPNCWALESSAAVTMALLMYYLCYGDQWKPEKCLGHRILLGGGWMRDLFKNWYITDIPI